MEKIIFWDFDGTLVKANTRFIDALQSALNERGFNVKKDLITAHLKSIFPWSNYDISYPNSTNKWWDSFFRNLSPFYTKHSINDPDKINEIFKDKITTVNDYVLYDDTKMVLQKCVERGYKNYLLSNNFPELPYFIADFELNEYFSGLVISSLVGYEKPRKELFDYAKNLANCKSGIMVGDNPVADITGGKGANLTTVLVHNPSPSVADYTFDTLEKILNILD